MPPFVDEDVEITDTERRRAWEEGLSNDIIILGQRYPLSKDGNAAFKRVRNFVDDPSLDFIKVGIGRGLPSIPVRERAGKPKTMEELGKVIQFCVMHTDLTKHARGTFDSLISHQPNPLSSHFCVNWNGIIYQYADVMFKTSHAGDTNDVTIGIDMNHRLVNIAAEYNRDDEKAADKLRAKYMLLTKESLEEQRALKGLPPFTPDELKRVLEKYEQERPMERKIQTGRLKTWGYSPIQYESLILMTKLFVRELNLAKSYPMGPDGQVISELLVDDDIKKLKGFVAHWHLCDSRWDPGPAFDWERVLAGMQNEYNSFPVVWDDKYLLQGKDVAAAKAAAFEITRNSEKARQGGTFPIGPNQTWHGGVHLFPPQDNPAAPKAFPVQTMFDGTVVAAHFEPSARELGHNNFVLLRHEVEIPDRTGGMNEDGTPKTTKLEFFALYMHLSPFDVPEARDGLSKEAAEAVAKKYEKLTWPRRLYELDNLKKDGGKDAVDKALDAFEAELKAQRQALDAALERGESVASQPGVAEKIPTETYEAQKAPPPYLTVGSGTGALADKTKVALLLTEGKGVRVSAGEWLGFTGLLPGVSSEVTLGEGETPLVSGVHVELFASEKMVNLIDLEANAEHFRTPQRSRGKSLAVETEDILMIFRQGDADSSAPYKKVKLWANEQISGESILEFFAREPEINKRTGKVAASDLTEAYREQLRRSITYHVSEWSDKVDWVQSILGGNPWAKETAASDFRRYVDSTGLFSKEIRRFLPFVWLTEDVAKGIGLTKGDWDGRVYHFHPIHFLMWVTYAASNRNRVFRTSLSLKDLRENQKRSAITQKLGKQGRAAYNQGAQSWAGFQSELDKLIYKEKLGTFDEKTIRKNEAVKQQFEAFKSKIIQLADGTLDLDEHDHDVPQNFIEAPISSSPKEVLKSLFDAEGKNLWQLNRRQKTEE